MQRRQPNSTSAAIRKRPPSYFTVGCLLLCIPWIPSCRCGSLQSEARALATSASAAARIAGGIALHYCRFFEAEFSLIGDAGTVAAVIDPEGAKVERSPMRVELSGSETRGATVFDRRSARQRDYDDGEWPGLDVVTSVDAARYRRLDGKGPGRCRNSVRLDRDWPALKHRCPANRIVPRQDTRQPTD